MLDPVLYGLPKRTRLDVYNDGIALVVDRKSRIVMADGKRILVKVLKLRQQVAGVPVVFKTTAPICSKTLIFFAEHGIAVIPAE